MVVRYELLTSCYFGRASRALKRCPSANRITRSCGGSTPWHAVREPVCRSAKATSIRCQPPTPRLPLSSVPSTGNNACRMFLGSGGAKDAGAGLLEVIVVDNASTDGTARVAARSWQGPQESLRLSESRSRGDAMLGSAPSPKLAGRSSASWMTTTSRRSTGHSMRST